MNSITLATPPLDHRPAVRTAIGVAATVIFALTVYGALRWLAGAAPPTPWVRETALAVHLMTIIPAIPLGAYVLLVKKGGPRHKLLGYVWLLLMLVTACATIFIRHINPGSFSFVHLLTLLTFIAVPQSVLAARRQDFTAHRRHMLNFYVGALMIAGVFTFLPGRTMWQWAFG